MTAGTAVTYPNHIAPEGRSSLQATAADVARASDALVVNYDVRVVRSDIAKASDSPVAASSLQTIAEDDFSSNNLNSPDGNLDWAVSVWCGVVSQQLEFDFNGGEENGDSWAEQRAFAVTDWGQEVGFEFDLDISADWEFPPGQGNDKLLNVWWDPAKTSATPSGQDLLTLMETVPQGYSLSGSLVTPSSPVGRYPRLGSARAEDCESRLPDSDDTWGIYGPLFTPADYGAGPFKVRMYFKAVYQGSICEIWRDDILIAQTIATDFSFTCPGMISEGQVYNSLYLLGYSNSGGLGTMKIDNFKIFAGRPLTNWVARDALSVGPYSASPSHLHTPTRPLTGVQVQVLQISGGDHVTGVTYGGVAMTRKSVQQKSTGEGMAVYSYFLGSGIPAGPQTVVITTDGASVVGAVIGYRGDGDTEVIAIGEANSDSAANPGGTLSLLGRAAVVDQVFVSGHDAVTGTAPVSSAWVPLETDAGAQTVAWYLRWSPTASHADVAWGVLQTAEDIVAIATAVAVVE